MFLWLLWDGWWCDDPLKGQYLLEAVTLEDLVGGQILLRVLDKQVNGFPSGGVDLLLPQDLLDELLKV